MKMPFSTRNDRYSSANVIRLWCSFCCMIYPMIVPFSLALLLRPAYSRAQPTKSGKFGFAFSHLLLSVFTRCTKEATVSVGGNDTKIWTWSGIPPPYAIGLAVEISCYPIDVSIKFAIVLVRCGKCGRRCGKKIVYNSWFRYFGLSGFCCVLSARWLRGCRRNSPHCASLRFADVGLLG